ncbi:hypothetical protein OA88_22825 [Flavobacterium sp. JRM]|nr:hypothetical protein OA88_22825 [Flavobacterium sp. JRM]
MVSAAKLFAFISTLVVVAILAYMGYKTVTVVQSKLVELEARIDAPQLRSPVESPKLAANFVEEEESVKEE